jgi:hypothetical protein
MARGGRSKRLPVKPDEVTALQLVPPSELLKIPPSP